MSSQIIPRPCHKTQRSLLIYSTAIWVSANAANEIGLTRHILAVFLPQARFYTRIYSHDLFPPVHKFTSPTNRHTVNYNVEEYSTPHTYVNTVHLSFTTNKTCGLTGNGTS